MKKSQKNQLNDEDLVAVNFTKPVIKVKHAKLERVNDSPYKSVCPACKRGLLMMRRDDKGKLMKDDYCILCGQTFEYTDINKE